MFDNPIDDGELLAAFTQRAESRGRPVGPPPTEEHLLESAAARRSIDTPAAADRRQSRSDLFRSGCALAAISAIWALALWCYVAHRTPGLHPPMLAPHRAFSVPPDGPAAGPDPGSTEPK